ncbi:MAG TPA: RdgB/HAM1 family non-canonical purine NTP pyrophosphatase [Mariprofundaceae bacterium]|nr:RdgB/HAM1 family non-canonical purine NTP pyrophosphatase [Mariprofundaceae bacterium]
MKIVLASNNAKKRQELASILAVLGVELASSDETVFVDVIEDGKTFADNARKKAEAFAAANNLPALADDSGLCVDALNGAPGVYSSRFAGEGASDADNNAKLLIDIQGVENRSAHFVCSLCLVFPDGSSPIRAEGRTDGVILSEPDGDQGFGYDPLFFSSDLNKSFASSSPEEKAGVSHRGRALAQFVEALKAVV